MIRDYLKWKGCTYLSAPAMMTDDAVMKAQLTE